VIAIRALPSLDDLGTSTLLLPQPRKLVFRNRTYVMQTFQHWLEQHNDNIPLHDQILPTIVAAGLQGISVEDLRKRFSAIEDSLFEWLRIFEEAGKIVQFVVGGKRYYRAV
jgi:hypothetical protein